MKNSEQIKQKIEEIKDICLKYDSLPIMDCDDTNWQRKVSFINLYQAIENADKIVIEDDFINFIDCGRRTHTPIHFEFLDDPEAYTKRLHYECSKRNKEQEDKLLKIVKDVILNQK